MAGADLSTGGGHPLATQLEIFGLLEPSYGHQLGVSWIQKLPNLTGEDGQAIRDKTPAPTHHERISLNDPEQATKIAINRLAKWQKKDERRGIYLRPNPAKVDPDRRGAVKKQDIAQRAYTVLIVDCDPNKAFGPPGGFGGSTSEEQAAALHRARWFHEHWSPISCLHSGNGYQGYLRYEGTQAQAKAWLKGAEAAYAKAFPELDKLSEFDFAVLSPSALCRAAGYRHPQTGFVATWQWVADFPKAVVDLTGVVAVKEKRKGGKKARPGALEEVPAAEMTPERLSRVRGLVQELLATPDSQVRHRTRLAAVGCLIRLGLDDGSIHHVVDHGEVANLIRSTRKRLEAGDRFTGTGALVRASVAMDNPRWGLRWAVAVQRLTREVGGDERCVFVPSPRTREDWARLASKAPVELQPTLLNTAACASTFVRPFTEDGEELAPRAIRCKCGACFSCTSIRIHQERTLAREALEGEERYWYLESLSEDGTLHLGYQLKGIRQRLVAVDEDGKLVRRWAIAIRAKDQPIKGHYLKTLLRGTARRPGVTLREELTGTELADQLADNLGEHFGTLQALPDEECVEQLGFWLGKRTTTSPHRSDFRWPSQEDRRQAARDHLAEQHADDGEVVGYVIYHGDKPLGVREFVPTLSWVRTLMALHDAGHPPPVPTIESFLEGLAAKRRWKNRRVSLETAYG